LVDRPDIRWVTLPLGVNHRPEITDAEWEPVVRFAGTLNQHQGVETLCMAWIDVRPPGWSLEIVGDGPCASQLRERWGSEESITWRGYQPPEVVWDLIARAGCLAAPYANPRGGRYQLSALKTLEYALTERPMVTSTRDVILDDLASEEHPLVFPCASSAVPDVALALVGAIDAAQRGERAVTRRKVILERRGPDAQRVALGRVLETAVTNEGRERSRKNVSPGGASSAPGNERERAERCVRI
jgi:glycosyltransferase involved in cell wall biosynthesis